MKLFLKRFSFSTQRRCLSLKKEGTIQTPTDPEIIDLGLGQPSPSLLPTNEIATNFSSAVNSSKSSWKWLQYGSKQGSEKFRNSLAKFLNEDGSYSSGLRTISENELFVTSGASSSIAYVSQLLTGNSKSTVFVEDPTYFLSLDDEGLIVDENLEKKFIQYRPSLLYTIPTYNNPKGTTMGIERRGKLIELARKYNCYILADEVYQLLSFRTKPPPSLIEFDNIENPKVVSLNSFSKILGPGSHVINIFLLSGLRLGWIEAKPKLISRFSNSGILNSGGCLAHFTSGVVLSSLENGFQMKHLENLKDIYKRRSSVLFKALKETLPSSIVDSISEPKGGYFIWVKLKQNIDKEMEESFIKNKVKVKTGKLFSCSSENAFANCIRLSFAYYNESELIEGVKRLGKSLQT